MVMATLLAMTKAQANGVLFAVFVGLAPRLIIIKGVVSMDTTQIKTIKVMAISRSVIVDKGE